ncbi:enoyl-CoA hydratase/isomerase family protein [Nesterenkonia marinintestina]|uniref:enoyl-CoA hydratase/isomerase family protein n=1 Tax=Nesterenkonia marinintestina TaxID=2979865 RepID=UPI0021C1DB8A|nr:enoyl-CoA hydratase-related protein [Nesterenkonia sp. GX14115]
MTGIADADVQQSEDPVLTANRDGIVVVTINRPQVHNAMNAEVLSRLAELLDAFEHDDSVRLLIFTGAGSKAFVAGADIRELERRRPVDGLTARMQRLYSRIEAFPKPTIAAVNGYAFGGGCELALACDVRIASTDAVFGLLETGLGIIPAAGGTQRLARMVGIGRATDMILTGRRVSGEEALTYGLVTEIVSSDDLITAAESAATRILAKGPLAVKLASEVIRRGFDVDQETGLLLERLAQSVIYSTDEKSEGTSAFLEGRRADFLSVHHDRSGE